jgi:lipoprotein signal peptidase
MPKNKALLLAVFLLLVVFFQISSYTAQLYWVHSLNNKGVLGSFGNNLVTINISLVGLFLIFIALITKKISLNIWTVMLLAGAASNILDRFIYKGVIDYLVIPKLFTFNLADLAISIGLIGLFYPLLSKK